MGQFTVRYPGIASAGLVPGGCAHAGAVTREEKPVTGLTLAALDIHLMPAMRMVAVCRHEVSD